MENEELKRGEEWLQHVLESDDELAHHGIKDQKWGIRRWQNKDGSLTPEGRKRYSKGDGDSDNGLPKLTRKEKKQKKLDDQRRKAALEKARATKEAKKRDAEEKEKILKSGDRKKIIENKHRFTDEELKKAIDRLDLEAKLSEPMAKKNIGKGEEVVREILTNSAKNIGQQTATFIMGYGVNLALGKIFDDPKVVNPKKGQKDK